ncbi:hypothetical protein GCM10010466_66810 [Planomonospora alba]|uniref:Uncharacterized protein n=1 Tax=Planomonospora alba TaxID=161354 RepID=A0ABP6P427_9ACTN
MPPPGRARTGRRVAGVLLAVFGVLLLLAGGGIALHGVKNSRQEIRNDAYWAGLWRNVPAEEIFPDLISMKQAVHGDRRDAANAQWVRLGIAPQTSCAAGLTGRTAERAEAAGCQGVVRATYADPSGDMIATVAVIGLPDGRAESELGGYLGEQEREDRPDLAVRSHPVPGTAAARWRDDRRNAASGTGVYSTYIHHVVAVTTGAADGRLATRIPAPWRSERRLSAERRPWAGAAGDLAQMFATYLGGLADKEAR